MVNITEEQFNSKNISITFWKNVNWRELKIDLFEKQKEIYSLRKKDIKLMHEKQEKLINFFNAKLLAVWKVIQENQGKKTAGVDGIKKLNKTKRIELAKKIRIDGRSQKIRQVWIEKFGKKEKIPLGIPTINDRLKQALLLFVQEPEWEAIFSAKSYGFRPGRGVRDAHRHMKQCLILGRKWIYYANIEKCFTKSNMNYY